MKTAELDNDNIDTIDIETDFNEQSDDENLAIDDAEDEEDDEDEKQKKKTKQIACLKMQKH